MSWLHKLVNNPVGHWVNTELNPLGIGTGGPMSSSGIGGFLKTMRPGETRMPEAPGWAADQAALLAEQQNERNLNKQYMTDSQNTFNTQNTALRSMLDQHRQNAETNLTTGPEGEQMREYYNKLGLLNSGAFNTGLANKFGEIEQGSEDELLKQGINQESVLQGILGQGEQNQIDLGQAGLQRQFGLEDEKYQGELNAVLAKRRNQSQTRGGLLSAGGSLLGKLIMAKAGGGG